MKKMVISFLICWSSVAKGGVSPGVVLDACHGNVTDPICYDLSLGRQYVDDIYRRYLTNYIGERQVIVLVALTNIAVQKRFTLILAKNKGLGAPELTLRRNEGVILFHWGF